MKKVIEFLKQEMRTACSEYTKQISKNEVQYIHDLKIAIETLQEIYEKPSNISSMPLKNTVAFSVDPCNESCTICKGKGFITMDQPTTGLKSLHKCTGTGIVSTPFKYIYPDWYPKDMRYQPEQIASFTATIK